MNPFELDWNMPLTTKFDDAFARDSMLNRTMLNNGMPTLMNPLMLITTDDAIEPLPPSPEDLRAEAMRRLEDRLIQSMMIPGDVFVESPSTTCTMPRDFTVDAIREVMEKVKLSPTHKAVEIYLNDSLGEWKQFRFPKTKNKRIRKKWSKRRENYRYVSSNTYYMIDGHKVIMHPDDYEKIKKETNANAAQYDGSTGLGSY